MNQSLHKTIGRRNWKNLFCTHTLVEPAGERVTGGAKPSKMDTAAPTSSTDRECDCGMKI